MPRQINASMQETILRMMKDGMTQRCIERETGISRQFIRNMSRAYGHQFPRNGVEKVGLVCMCSNCGIIFKKPPSKVKRAKHQFCDAECKKAYFRGVHHPNWSIGKSAASWSSFVKNQSEYKNWVQAVLERDGNKCVISGRTDNLQAHHIFMKAEEFNPEKSFDPSNGITVNFEIHNELHKIIREGTGFQEAIEQLKRKYATTN